ncbi:MAG: hypothetical protein FWG89_02595 [Treponema sp.]|nr:hypothetical protein [Treponema sp.]
MKSMIKLLGIIVLAAVIGFPVMAQPAPTNEVIQVLQPRPNAVSNLLHKHITGFGRQFFRVDNLTDPFYYILWRDADSSANLAAPFADIRISVLNITGNRVITVLADVDRTLNEEREINSIEITRGVHYNSGDSILIIVESFEASGNYAILVY